MIMDDANARTIEEIGTAVREMERVLEGFRLEKEDALQAGGTAALQALRERSRTHHQVLLRDLERTVRTLAARIRTDGPGAEEAEEAAAAACSLAGEILAHLASAPSRLLRAFRTGGMRSLREPEPEEGPDPDGD